MQWLDNKWATKYPVIPAIIAGYIQDCFRNMRNVARYTYDIIDYRL